MFLKPEFTVVNEDFKNRSPTKKKQFLELPLK